VGDWEQAASPKDGLFVCKSLYNHLWWTAVAVAFRCRVGRSSSEDLLWKRQPSSSVP
jgi:hypothetical protein